MENQNDFVISNGVLTKYKGSDKCVVIPDGVTVIGERAFMFNGTVESIVVPEGVTAIESDAFGHCDNLEEVAFPASLKKMSSQAFSGFHRLERLKLASLDTWFHLNIKKDIFSFTNPMSGAELYVGGTLINHLVIPSGVTTIFEKAFSGCKSITKVTLPKGNIFVGDSAFS